MDMETVNRRQSADNSQRLPVVTASESSENHDKEEDFCVEQGVQVWSEINIMNTEEKISVEIDSFAPTLHPADQATSGTSNRPQMYITAMSKNINVSESTSQPVTSEETTPDISSTEVDKCKRFATEMYHMLEQRFEEFWNLFRNNPMVVESFRKIFFGLIVPLFHVASSGDKLACLEFCKIATVLWHTVGELTFLGPSSGPSEALQNLENLIPNNDCEDFVPLADVVQITSTEDTGQPDRQILNVTERSNWGESSVQTECKNVESFHDIGNKISQLTENQHEVDIEQDLKIVINQNVAADCYSFGETQKQCGSFCGRIERQYIRGKCSTVHNIPSVVSGVAEMPDDDADDHPPSKKRRKLKC